MPKPFCFEFLHQVKKQKHGFWNETHEATPVLHFAGSDIRMSGCLKVPLMQHVHHIQHVPAPKKSPKKYIITNTGAQIGAVCF